MAEEAKETLVEKHGIEGVKKILGLAVEAGNMVEKMVAEKGGRLKQFAHMMMLGDEVFALAGVEWKNLGNEFKDIDAAEMAELNTFVEEKFDLANDQVEVIVERSIKTLVSLGGSIMELVALGKAVSAAKKVEA